MWDRYYQTQCQSCSVGDAAAASEASDVETTATEMVEVESGAAAAEAATEEEERAYFRVGGALLQGHKETEVPRGCGCTMNIIYLPFPFGTGKTHKPFWRGRSYPQSRATFFARTGTCKDCTGRTTNGKTHTFPPLLMLRHP